MYRKAANVGSGDFAPVELKAADSVPREPERREIVAPVAVVRPDHRPSKRGPSNRAGRRIAQRMTGPRWFYDLMLREYPALSDPAKARFFLYLLSPTRIGDDGDGPPLIGGDIIAGSMGRSPEYAMGNLKGAESTRVWLRRFRRDALPSLEYTDFEKGRQREVVRHGIKPTVLAAWETVRGLRPHLVEDRVWLDTGEPYNAFTLHQERKRIEEEMAGYSDEVTTPLTGKLRDYLDSVHPRNFALVWDNLDAAYDLAATFEGERRRQVEAQLNIIAADPIQRYRFSKFTARLSPMGAGLGTVPSEVRRVLLSYAVEYDLRSAQLAIVAKDWGLPLLLDYLRTGRSVWPVLWAAMDLGPEAKAAIKRGVYAIVYGAGEARVRKDVAAEYASQTCREMPSGAVDRFLAHPFIVEVLEAREAQLLKIGNDGGAEDCFGRWIEDGKHEWYEGPERSILAQVNQSRELWLMEPLIDLAIEEAEKASPDWRIVLWQHDGVSITFSRRRDLYERRIIEAVAARADAHGYPTGLEVG